MTTFMTRKGYGRIYVKNAEDVETVVKIIHELDEYEHRYLPVEFVAPFSEYPTVRYTHKFCDLDLDRLMAVCMQRGIHIWIFDSRHDEMPSNLLTPPGV